MKTFKTMIAVLAVSLVSTSAFADVPVDAQRGLEKAEMHKRMKDAQATKAKQTKTKKAKKSGQKLDHDKHGQLAKARPLPLPDHYQPRPSPVANGNLAAKRNENSAKGLDAGQKEARKHLLHAAKIERLREIATMHGNLDLLERVKELGIKENLRHDRAVQRLATSGRTHVGSPQGD